MSVKKIPFNFWVYLGFFVLILITRWNYIYDPLAILDGDECVLGLMSHHWLEGTQTPLYFYGQSYGFAGIELLFTNTFQTVFGESEYTLRWSILFIWFIGVCFFYKSLLKLNDKQRIWAVVITLILISSPVWTLWSIKVRNGYVSAFTLSSIYTYLLWSKWKFNHSKSILLGILAVVIYQSQPLWLPSLVVLHFWEWKKNYNRNETFSLIFSIGVTTILFFLYKRGLDNFWNLPFDWDPMRWLKGLLEIPGALLTQFRSTFYLEQTFDSTLLSWIYGIAFSVMIALLIFFTVFFGKKQHRLIGFAVALVVTLLLPVIFSVNSYRYFLPVNAIALLLLFMLIVNHEIKWNIGAGAVITIIGLGFFVSFQNPFLQKNDRFKYYSQYSKIELLQTIDYLNTKQIQYVVSLHNLAQWQIMYYSQESILVRSFLNEDRIQEYVDKVNNAISNDEKTVLLLFNAQHWKDIPADRIHHINSHFVVLLNPSKGDFDHFQIEF